MDIYLVGGAVRDQLLGLDVKERDYVVVGATPEDLLSQGFQPVGQSFPVFLHPKTKEEYALARKERKTEPGYRGFSVDFSADVTLEEDLLRRDLSINAMAQAKDGSLIDPYGGQQDIRNKQLRHVSKAFVEDPVRLVRLARFYARFYHLGFRVANETKNLCECMVENQEVDALVPERVWQELSRALNTNHPEAFFDLLHEVGAWNVVLHLPWAQEGWDKAKLLAAHHSFRCLPSELKLAFLLLHWSWEDILQSLSALKSPKRFITQAKKWHAVYQHIRILKEIDAAWLDRLFALLGVWGKGDFSEVIEPLKILWEINGRDFKALEVFSHCYEQAMRITPQQAIAAGYQGKAITDWLQKQRMICLHQGLLDL